MEKYLTISEAAKKIGVSKETLRRGGKSRKFKSLRHPINNYRVYTVDQIDYLIKELKFDYAVERKEPIQLFDPFFKTKVFV